jgi:glycosyltransferase involved in cell wall biosynthesis
MADTSVIICTSGRAEVLHDTILNVLNQTIQPAEILVVIYHPAAVLPQTRLLPLVKVISSAQGLCTQRNFGAANAAAASKYLLFMDDDMELMSNFLASQERLFEEFPEVVLSSAATIANGAGLEPLTRLQAQQAVTLYQPRDLIEYHGGAYGCNMFVRRDVMASARFDENLPLYAMMEDHDFSAQCVRVGRAAWNFRTGVAHLAASGGRINGRQVGYSQIANPFYLWRKGSITFSFCFWNCWLRFIASNTLKALFSSKVLKSQAHARLTGNLSASKDLLLGRIHPRNILTITQK